MDVPCWPIAVPPALSQYSSQCYLKAGRTSSSHGIWPVWRPTQCIYLISSLMTTVHVGIRQFYLAGSNIITQVKYTHSLVIIYHLSLLILLSYHYSYQSYYTPAYNSSFNKPFVGVYKNLLVYIYQKQMCWHFMKIDALYPFSSQIDWNFMKKAKSNHIIEVMKPVSICQHFLSWRSI